MSQWPSRARANGVEALRRRKVPGAEARLRFEQKAQIPEPLERDAEAFGFRANLSTRKRVATVIQREFGMSYHPSHVGRIVHQVGWSLQKPVRRAAQRDEEAIRTW